MENKLDSILIFGFFGFYREGHKYSYNFDIKSSIYNKYIYSPTIINEDTNDKLHSEDLIEKFGDNVNIKLYEYDKEKHITKSKLYCEDKFINQWYQQAYRIFSFFYNIKGVSQLIKDHNYNDNDIIILSRIDIGLSIVNIEQLTLLLNKNDVIVTRLENNCVDDKLFIFKYKYIDVFIKLYDEYGAYITKIKSNDPDSPVSTRPEDIFFYHFIKNNLKIESSNLINYHFKHVCSKYCGHNEQNTMI